MTVWSKNRYTLLIGVVVVIGSALLWLLAAPESRQPDKPRSPVLTAVTSAPLTIAVNVAGSLKPRDQVVVINKLEGQTTIISIVDEGKKVKKGDLLIELDSSALQNKLIDQQIAVQGAKASYVRARENVAVVKNQGQSDVEAARLAAKFARDDLTKYQQGEFPNQKKEQLAKIAVKQEELRRAKEKLSWSKVLFSEKYLSQTELEADELAAKKARIDLELSRSNLQLLLDFNHVRRMDELNAAVKKTASAMVREQRKAKSGNVQAAADLQAKKALFERENARLEKLREELDKTRIRAPQDGVVVYATSLQRGWRSVEPLAAGQGVRERQELIYLPSSGIMVAATQVSESELAKVKVGQAALVYVDSVKGRSFRGKVKSVAQFPDTTSSWLNPDLKLYRTEVELLEHSDALRSGMNCRVEIKVSTIEDALSIPIQAVVMDGGKPFVYRAHDGVLARCEVQLGQNNDSMVQILSGVERGDRVQINPPLTPTTGRR